MTNTCDTNAPLHAVTELTLLAAEVQKLKKAVYSKSADKTVEKAVLTLRRQKDRLFFQIETFWKDNKVTHKNLPTDALSELEEFAKDFSQINLITTDGSCEYRRSAKGNSVLLGGEKLKRRLLEKGGASVAPTENNREKQYILNGTEPFLRALGVSDENGRIHDCKQSKFRQINRFLELIRDVEHELPTDRLRICDLCCGKSYLSFAVYHYFAVIKGIPVSMTGVDLKEDVIKFCNQTAQSLGFDGLEFVCGDIRDYDSAERPSLVISLHACDIATDLVLNKAADWKTDVILSTPCCHHELQHHIDCPTLSFITDYSMLRQKLCDAATDALRLCRLEAQGYTTAALELIDPDETPKNIMLRAVRNKKFRLDSPEAEQKAAKYRAAKAFLCGKQDTEAFHF